MLKTKEERLKEGITLLKKLRDAGVPADNLGFKEIQKAVSDWVVNGESFRATIPITRYDRDADITLPEKKGQTAQIVLRKVPQ